MQSTTEYPVCLAGKIKICVLLLYMCPLTIYVSSYDRISAMSYINDEKDNTI